MNRKRVYVAGPISRGDLQHNIDQSREASRELMRAGLAPLNPMLTCFADSNTPSASAGFDHATWLSCDLSWVAVADALLRLPGESTGADAEVAFARQSGVPVFYSVPETVEYFAEQNLPPLVAFAGYARAGKDEAARCLVARGYTQRAFGDVIKKQLDVLVRLHFGFSAFTDDGHSKSRIRPILEQWGEVNYDAILREFFDTLPARCVNPRLVRVREAYAWRQRGGVLLLVDRWDDMGRQVGPATAWEGERLEELKDAGYIDGTIVNNGSIQDLHHQVLGRLGTLRTATQRPSHEK